MSIANHSWLPKAIAQKIIAKAGWLPLYHKLQQKGGRLQNFHPKSRVEYAAKLYSDTLEQIDINNATLVEIGTGWVPVVPLVLHLMGAKKIITYDLNPHLQPDLTLKCVPLLDTCLSEIKRRTGIEESGLRERLKKLYEAKTISELFQLAGIEYRAPADVSKSNLADASVDIVYSNLVLEHVTPQALQGIFSETHRILKPNGICWHNVDFSDHYSATNRRLSSINFLQYSDGFWETWGQNDILYQNRWRYPQYVSLFRKQRFSIASVIRHTDAKVPKVLGEGLRLHGDFQGHSVEDLETISARFVLRREEAGPAH